MKSNQEMTTSNFVIIVPFHNNPVYTWQTIESIEKNTYADYQLILVDNGSTSKLIPSSERLHHKVIRLEKNEGFSKAANVGINYALEKSNCDAIVLLNNDVIVGPNWLGWLWSDLKQGQKRFKDYRFGMIGPVSNNAARDQKVKPIADSLEKLEEAVIQYRREKEGQIVPTSFLSGFCLMIERYVFDEVGLFDERFSPGGFEDNDFCIRCAEHGILGLISFSVYVHHFGQKTFQTINVAPLSMRLKYFQKYKKKRAKFVGMYRVKNDADKLRKSLRNTAKIFDEVVIFDDCSKDDSVERVAKEFPVVIDYYKKKFEKLTEVEDRNKLLQMALKRKPDWIMSIDADEWFFPNTSRALLNRFLLYPDPLVKSLVVHFYTLWDSPDLWRKDGIFGSMNGPRIFRASQAQKIVGGGEGGLHCPHIPLDAMTNVTLTPIKIIHEGYLNQKDRMKKFNWYQTHDTKKNKNLIGAVDYHHLIDIFPELSPIRSQTLTLCAMTPGPNYELYEFLARNYLYFDEVWLLNTKPEKRLDEVKEIFPDIKIIPHKFQDNFAAARNALLDSIPHDYNRWIFWMDLDEEIALPSNYVKYFETDQEMLLIDVYEIMPNGEAHQHQLVRAHRHIRDLRFSNRVHENFDRAKKEHPWLRAKEVPFKIFHYGFTKGKEVLRQKFDFYKKLIMKEISENPKHAQAYFDLALHQIEEGNRLAAIQNINRCLELDPNFFEARRHLAIMHLQAANKCFRLLAESDNVPRYLKRAAEQVLNIIAPITPPENRLLDYGFESIKQNS